MSSLLCVLCMYDDVLLFDCFFFFFFQAEDGIRDLVRSRGLGDVYKRQIPPLSVSRASSAPLLGSLASSPSSR